MIGIPLNRSIEMSNSIVGAANTWSTDGRSQFGKIYNELIGNEQTRFEAELAVKQVLLSLCKSCLQGSQSVETVTSIFTEIQELVANPSMVTDFLVDLFGTLDIELFPVDESINKETYKQRYFQLISKSDRIVPTSSLMERMEIETLEFADLIVNREQFNQKYVRIKTRLYYKQQKFNLLREESEGFSKAITELNQDFSANNVTSKQLYDRLMALIGYFDIDPNRMLDLVLESFECNLSKSQVYIELLNLLNFHHLTLSQLIGFKFQQYQLQEQTVKSLYLSAAQLISNNLISVEDLLPHIYPLVTDFGDQFNKELDAARSAKKVTPPSADTTGKGKDPYAMKSNNQLLHLIEALLLIGDLEHVLLLLNLLPRYSCTSFREINGLLSQIIAFIIDPLYRSHNDLHSTFLKYELKNPLNQINSPRMLPSVSNWNEFKEKILPLTLHLGGFCQDRLLLMKLIRITTYLMKTNSSVSDDQRDQTLILIDEVFLPSLSLIDANGCLSIELWSLIKQFPFDVRYALYGQWQEDTYRKVIPLILVKQEVSEKIRAILRRIARDNVKTYSRQIAKVTHNNPAVVLTLIIDQVQRFDSFISVTNDALKYLSPLAYDVLCFTILRSLSMPVTSDSLANFIDGKMSPENATPAQWFQNLCALSANVFKKYPIDFASILHYIYDQLRAEKTCDLFLLREIITKMSGVEVSSSITRDQLEAASGGELLRSEAGQFNAARNVKKPSIRLKEALVDNQLYLPLSISIAQQRGCIAFKFGAQRSEHLKLIGSLYDQCQDTMVQFFTFLANVLTTENFHHQFPSIDDLVLGFHLQVDAAFQILRPLFNANIQAKYDELRSAAPRSTNKSGLIQYYIQAVDKVLSPVLDFVKTLHPQRTWEEMTPQFYLTFWSLSMSDLQVPESAYDRRLNELRQEMNQIDERKDLTAAKKRKEKEKIHVIIDKLNEELIKQKEHVERVRAYLEIEREHWFKNRNKTRAEMITEFLQLCIFPRCLLSDIDALYCAHFIRVIHDLVTPNFSTIICYDRLFSDISYSLASCSENEANRYGRFIQSLLETVMSWHADKNKFDRECANHPGFLTIFRNAGTSSSSKSTGSVQNPEQLDYDNFRHVCHKWHYKLTKSFIVCLESTDYVQIRNVLKVLTVLLPIYPKLRPYFVTLERRTQNICDAERDRRHDLFALAKCYNGLLSNREVDMIDERQFHTVPDRPVLPKKSTDSSTNLPASKTSNSTPTTTNVTDPSTKTSESESSDRRMPKESVPASASARNVDDKTTRKVVTGSSPSSPKSPTQITSGTNSPNNRHGTNNHSSASETNEHNNSKPAAEGGSNQNGTANGGARTGTSIVSKTSRIPSGSSLPSARTGTSSSASVKGEQKETSLTFTTTSNHSKDPSSNNDRYVSAKQTTSSAACDISPPSKKQVTSSDRTKLDNTSTTSKTASSPNTRPSSSRGTSQTAVPSDGTNRKTDSSSSNGTTSKDSSRTKRGTSPYDELRDKRVVTKSKTDQVNISSHSDEPRNGNGSRSSRDAKHDSYKRTRSSTPDKRGSNGSNSSSISTRRSNQANDFTVPSTTLSSSYQESEHNSSSSGVTDVSPGNSSTKRIKTSGITSTSSSETRKDTREDRHGSSSSSHRISSSSRSERRDKHHSSKENK